MGRNFEALTALKKSCSFPIKSEIAPKEEEPPWAVKFMPFWRRTLLKMLSIRVVEIVPPRETERDIRETTEEIWVGK
jgi:hypothetical protein